MVHLVSKLDGDRRAIVTFACLYGWAVDPSLQSPDNIKPWDMAKGTGSAAFYREYLTRQRMWGIELWLEDSR